VNVEGIKECGNVGLIKRAVYQGGNCSFVLAVFIARWNKNQACTNQTKTNLDFVLLDFFRYSDYRTYKIPSKK